MTIIHKHLLTNSATMLDLPLGAQILTIQMQQDQPVLWEYHDQNEVRTQRRQFVAINTGQSFEFPGDMHRYIATTTSTTGVVWHVFEVQ